MSLISQEGFVLMPLFRTRSWRACGLLALAIFLPVLASCVPVAPFQSELPTPTLQLTPEQTPAPTPAVSPLSVPLRNAEGQAAFTGIAYSVRFENAIPETAWYMVPAKSLDTPLVLAGPEADEAKYSGKSGADGRITVENLEPGDYFLVIWAPYGWIPAATAPDGEVPLVISMKAGEQRDFGQLLFPWP